MDNTMNTRDRETGISRSTRFNWKASYGKIGEIPIA